LRTDCGHFHAIEFNWRLVISCIFFADIWYLPEAGMKIRDFLAAAAPTAYSQCCGFGMRYHKLALWPLRFQ
jgi:hypothetical protein